jgi:hypothetical protein
MHEIATSFAEDPHGKLLGWLAGWLALAGWLDMAPGLAGCLGSLLACTQLTYS